MRRAAVLALAVLAPAGCSLLIDDDGLSGGEPSSDAATPDVMSAIPDVVTADADGGVDAEPVDADAGDPYVAAVRGDGPLAYWRVEEPVGDLFRDELGLRPLTIIHPQHATLAADGARGRAVSLDGNTELRMGGPPIDFAPNKTFTIECWIRPTALDAAYRHIFTKMTFGPTGPVDGTYLFVNGGLPLVGFERWREGTTRDFAFWNSRPPASAFTHLAVVVDGVRTKIYANGLIVGTAPGTGEPAANPNVELSWGFNFAGDLDELAFYEKALSAERVKAHFDAARP